jgi:CRP-like cAMP-binding protein
MAELNLVEKVIALEGVELFGILPPEHVANIASIATEVQLPPNSLIYGADKPVDALYVILDGAVELSEDGRILDSAGPNAILGAWALFDDEDPIRLTARSVHDTHLLRIGRDEFYDLLVDNSEITMGILSMLVKRFRRLVEAGNRVFTRQEAQET